MYTNSSKGSVATKVMEKICQKLKNIGKMNKRLRLRFHHTRTMSKPCIGWASVFIKNVSNQPNWFMRSFSECSINLIIIKVLENLFWIGSKTDSFRIKCNLNT